MNSNYSNFMLKIHGPVFLLFTALAMASCKPEKEAKTKQQLALEELDTLYLNPVESGLEIDRYRVIVNKNEFLRLGKLGLKLHVSDLSTSIKSSFKIDSGFVIYNRKTFNASCYFLTSQISGITIDQNVLKLGTPGYILNTDSKYIRFEFRGNFFPHEQEPTTAIFLTAGDSTGLITTHDSRINLAYGKKKDAKKIESWFYLDGVKWKFFEKENEHEIVKDSISGKIKLVFN